MSLSAQEQVLIVFKSKSLAQNDTLLELVGDYKASMDSNIAYKYILNIFDNTIIKEDTVAEFKKALGEAMGTSKYVAPVRSSILDDITI